ncbi:MAG: Txe/YoeB family addiction module toxin [Bacteroidota bacterium]|nr:Txe/YoeB family addiction module toxin [Bacteroidota bacterium]
MNIEFTILAWEDFNYWIEYDLTKFEKIKELIHAIRLHPFKGLGNPEPLKYELSGFWSRRIDHEHRLIYRVIGTKGKVQKIQIIQCRYHYFK